MDTVQKLHSMLVYYQYNLRILHWKIKGDGFDQGHALMEEYVNQFSEFIDKVGEILLSFNNSEFYPLSLEGIITSLRDDNGKYFRVDATRYFTKEDVFNCTYYMFTQLMEVAYQARGHVPEDVSGEIDSIIYWLRIENSYKMKQRMYK